MFNLIFILFIHWLADFVFQTNKMATNKSKSLKWLSVHVLTYTNITYIGFMIITEQVSLFFIVVFFYIFITHWIVDLVTSKINAKLWDNKKVHWFFVSIGFDQWIHFVSLILLYSFFNVI